MRGKGPGVWGPDMELIWRIEILGSYKGRKLADGMSGILMVQKSAWSSQLPEGVRAGQFSD